MSRIDDTDMRLIDALRQDARLPNKMLAQQLGISETTVAARLKQLQRDRVMLVTLRRDLRSRGFNLQCFAEVHVTGRSIDAVARDLAGLEAVSSVSEMLGSPEIMVVFNAADHADMQRFLQHDLAPVRGIGRVELHTTLSIRKYQPGYADLSGR